MLITLMATNGIWCILIYKAYAMSATALRQQQRTEGSADDNTDR